MRELHFSVSMGLSPLVLLLNKPKMDRCLSQQGNMRAGEDWWALQAPLSVWTLSLRKQLCSIRVWVNSPPYNAHDFVTLLSVFLMHTVSEIVFPVYELISKRLHGTSPVCLTSTCKRHRCEAQTTKAQLIQVLNWNICEQWVFPSKRHVCSEFQFESIIGSNSMQSWNHILSFEKYRF